MCLICKIPMQAFKFLSDFPWYFFLSNRLCSEIIIPQEIGGFIINHIKALLPHFKYDKPQS